jgi:hypothetical protein
MIFLLLNGIGYAAEHQLITSSAECVLSDESSVKLRLLRLDSSDNTYKSLSSDFALKIAEKVFYKLYKNDANRNHIVYYWD